MSNDALLQLADAAGIAVHWRDASERPQTVAPDALRAILAALDLSCETDAQCSDSRARLAAEHASAALPPLLTAELGLALPLAAQYALHGRSYRIEFEQGGHVEGQFPSDASLPLIIAPIDRTGYHRLMVGNQQSTLAVAPARCYGIGDALADAKRSDTRCWGLGAQLYSLRRAGDGGLADFTALAMLAQASAAQGASALAISPVHAMFSADRTRFSPYGPSSRLFLNALHIDPAAVLGEQALLQVLAEIGTDENNLRERLENSELVDWPAAAGLRLELLRRLYGQFKQCGTDRQTAFEQFRLQGGEALRDHACFEALHAWFSANGRDGVNGYWRSWPAEYRDPRSAAVEAFANEHADEVSFHAFLQWQASCGLSAAQQSARDAGMPIGLIADLAVGADNGGSQAWSRQQELIIGLSVGAPPDHLNALGQSWGLGAFSPRALQLNGFRAYIEMLRAAFASAGGVRIDHVLGLERLWLVPDGASAGQGAYLRYPIDDLLRLIALESWRYRAIVIGEDLGTIPAGFGERLAQAGLAGIRVMLFQRHHGRYLAPAEWSAHAIATTTTHDTPTFAGWWEGHDIGWRTRLDLREAGNTEAAELHNRSEERAALWQAFRQAGCASGEVPPPRAEAAPLEEAIAFLAATDAPLAMLPLEDLLGLPQQPNLPGTVDSHPNWRRRLPQPADQMLDDPRITARLARLRNARPISRAS